MQDSTFTYLDPSLVSILVFSCSLILANSSLVVSYRAVTWLKGFSGLFSNSFLIFSIFWFFLSPKPVPSSSISFILLSSYLANAALNRLSGCLSILAASEPVASDNASRALSIPDALSARKGPAGVSSSSCDRSSPRVFLAAVLAFFGWALLGRLASSSRSRASFSAFLRAASARFASSASLL